MTLEHLNHRLFELLDASNASSGAVASLEALAVSPIWVLPVVVAGTWLLGGRAERVTAVMTVLAGCVSVLAAHAASVAIDHPRPFMIGLAPNLLGHAADSSFPSDHATLFFATAVMFHRRPPPGMPGLGSLLGCLGLGVGLARVALGVHFPLDVLGAIAIGAAAAYVTDLGLVRPGMLLFACGERVRRFIGPLADRDDRETGERSYARPSR